MNPISASIAAACGAVYAWSAVQFWSWFLLHSPALDWLSALSVKTGDSTAYYLASYTHDYLVNIIIALPFAAVLAMLRPRNRWPHVCIAVAVALLVSYWPLLLGAAAIQGLASPHSLYFSVFASASSLPLAFLLVLLVQQRRGA